jgi:hypothetical protein
MPRRPVPRPTIGRLLADEVIGIKTYIGWKLDVR